MNEIQLIKAKYIPCLLYGLEACPIGTMELNSLNFAVKRILFKIFRTNSNDIYVYNTELSTVLQFSRHERVTYSQEEKFLTKFSVSDNCLRHFVHLNCTNGSSLQQLI